MKKLVYLTSILALTGCDLFKSKKVEGEKKLDRDKGSYAIGLQVGQNFKQQNMQIEYKSFSDGVKDALEGRVKYDKQEVDSALLEMQKDMVQKTAEKAVENKKEADKFLEENKLKSGVKTTKTGLQYIIESAGTGKTPHKDSQIKVHYVGTLTNGQEFDNSVARKSPLDLKLSQAMAGWQEGLGLIKSGGKIKLFIPPELGYGNSARPGIPANSVTIFEIELLEVK